MSKWLPRHWALWSAPSVVLTYVLIVDALALAVIGASFIGLDVGSDDWIRFGALVIGSALHVEAGREIERLRAVVSEGTTYVNLKSMWIFAAVLLLPLPLAIAVIAISYVHSWARMRRNPPYRGFFSASTVILGSALAVTCLRTINPDHQPGFTGGLIGLVAVTAAALAYWLINFALVVGAVLLSNPEANARKALGQLSDQLIVAGAQGLGVSTAALLIYQPWLSVALLITVLGLHRALLVGQFQFAARTDSNTGLANTMFWHELAAKELERAQNNKTPLGVLYLDLDHFKSVNDTYGHLAGDQVLKAIAAELQREIRAEDLVGRLGGEEFAILLPMTNADDTLHTAERIRHRISGLVITVTTPVGDAIVEGITCSIGAATYPASGQSLDILLMAADTATYAAKESGRNRVVTAPSRTPGQLN
ncbi:diguanylate cyclase [Kribbella sp. NPDC051587]|uniref:diguanylate cyclase n=1 Tax=Kribbella sp. NPDC051587 TaxID=3364119 RepID=UPI0037A6D2F3